MALTTQIDILTNRAVVVAEFLKIYDSTGKAYTATNPRIENSGAAIVYDLALDGVKMGRVNITDPDAPMGNAMSGWNTPKPAFANSMIYTGFLKLPMQTAPYITRLNFTQPIDVGSVAFYSTVKRDLEIRVFDENLQDYKSSTYTAEQQMLDYPESVTENTYNANETSSFVPPIVSLDNRGALPQMLRVVSKNGLMYFKPKLA